MGRKSIKENKNIYQLTREALGYTREQAGDLVDGMSAEHIEKLENEKINIYPEDVLMLSRAYKAPELCAYFCSHECPIGRERVPEAKIKELSQITVEAMNYINRFEKGRDRLLEIIEDENITPDEYEDFKTIKLALDKLAIAAADLSLWVDKACAEGKIQKDKLK